MPIKPDSGHPQRETETMPDTPPENLPTYRVLTGPDDASFCRRVSEAIELGYLLYGPPSTTFNGETVIVAQAIIWPGIQGSIALAKGERA